MKNSHTQGKWEVKEVQNDYFTQLAIVTEINGAKICIAKTDGNNQLTDSELIANAKLIASTPKLLEALVELKKSMDETIKWQNGGIKHLSQAEQDRYKIICESINNATK